MPKYNITLIKKYEFNNIEARKIEDAEVEAWKLHKQNLSSGHDQPSNVYTKHKRVREEEAVLTHKQKKELKKEQDGQNSPKRGELPEPTE